MVILFENWGPTLNSKYFLIINSEKYREGMMKRLYFENENESVIIKCL